jgi:hypothetical protein
MAEIRARVIEQLPVQRVVPSLFLTDVCVTRAAADILSKN